MQSTPKADGTAYWSVRPSFHLAAHDEPVDVMAWSPDGRTLVAGADKKVYLWDVKVNRTRITIKTKLIAPNPDWRAEEDVTGVFPSWGPDQCHTMATRRIGIPRSFNGLQAGLLCELSDSE